MTGLDRVSRASQEYLRRVTVREMKGAFGLGLLLHAYTVFVAYQAEGLFAAALTLVFPPFSELYWFFTIWNGPGLWHPFCISVLAYIGWWAALFGLALANRNQL